MISWEEYYEEYLEGKNAEQIMAVIRDLKQEIDHLKNTMEHPKWLHLRQAFLQYVEWNF